MLRLLGLAALWLATLAPANALQETTRGAAHDQAPTARGDFAKPMEAGQKPSPYPPGPLAESTPGFFLRAYGEERFRFTEWTTEHSLVEALAALRGTRKDGSDETAEVRMAPGRYVIEQHILIEELDHLTISGGAGVEFVFADGPDYTTHLVAPAQVDDLVLRVEEPGLIREGFRYQVYPAKEHGDRLLEFTALAVKDGLVYLDRPVHYMPHVAGVPAGARIVEEVNFFRVRKCAHLTLEGLRCDGRHRGGTRTHTTYCGVYATGHYVEHQRATTKGLTVRNCSFKNLKGRGVAFYGMEDVRIEGNYFEHIRAQAIEIDHFASGHVLGNVINGAQVGVMVNDAYESVVEGNVIRHCLDGVRFLEVYADDWVNTGNVVRDNLIGPGLQFGVCFFNDGMVDNIVEGNVFIGYADEARISGGEGNTIRWGQR